MVQMVALVDLVVMEELVDPADLEMAVQVKLAH
jgi:hypothetical protein